MFKKVEVCQFPGEKSSMPKPKPPTEAHEGAMLAAWARLSLPADALFCHIPNGGARSRVTGAMLKGQGVVAGVPDYLLAIPTATRHGLWIELKRRGAGMPKASPAQIEVIRKLEKHGYSCRVCAGWEDAARTIMAYLNGKLDGI